MRAVEIRDGPIGQLLEMGEQPVDALDAARGVVAEHRHRAGDTGAGTDLLGGHGHLGFDAVQLVPAPGVDLLRVAGHAEPPTHADGIELAPDGVTHGGLRRVLLAHEGRHRRVGRGCRLRALAKPAGHRVVVRHLGGDAGEVGRVIGVETTERCSWPAQTMAWRRGAIKPFASPCRSDAVKPSSASGIRLMRVAIRSQSSGISRGQRSTPSG